LETKVWKKAGIVVAASFAATLAFGPIAYAAPSPGGEEGADDAEQVIKGDDAPQKGLVNLGDVDLLNGVNICPDVTALVGLGNVLGILGIGAVDQQADDAPITCETSATPEH
jgi:PDZ domain-containing secreted protein